MPTARYRADLIELAWAIERKFGLPNGADEALGSAVDGDEGAFGLLSGGVTLPDPNYEWEPFYGVGVVDRNFNFPVQGREILEGSLPTVYLTHNNSRMFLEQLMGLIYNSTATSTRAGVVTTTGVTLNDASAVFETNLVKNAAALQTGVSDIRVLVETDGGGTAGAADETTAHDDAAATLSISFNTADDRLYIGSSTPFTHVRIDIGATPNGVAAVMIAEFSDIDGSYALGGISRDGTNTTPETPETGAPLAVDGTIVLDPPPSWGRTLEGDAGGDNRYWVRLSFGAVTLTAATLIVDIDLHTSHPTHIIIIHEAGAGGAVDLFKDTFAYIGPPNGTTVAAGDPDTDGETLINVYADFGLTRPGWQGKAPLLVESGGNTNYQVSRISRSTGTGVLPDATGAVHVRETLVQPSFTLGARFTAEDGARFSRNYTGNKVSRATFSFEENRPVTYSADFMAQDMRHDLGTNFTVIKNSPDTLNPTFRRVSEQPYFFSRAELRFSGTAFARFRRLSLVIDNQLDPRYYVTQGSNTDNRQVLVEILEGRRQITLSGTVDLDDTVSDAQFLRYLLNQGFTDLDRRDMATLQGITLVIELERLQDASSGPSFDRMTFTLPSGTLGTNNTGINFRSAPHPIPAPPAIHHEIELDMLASSMQLVIDDSIS